MKAVRAAGGTAGYKSPQGAQSPTMPRSAMEIGGADAILDLDEIAAGVMPAAGARATHVRPLGLMDQGR